ncbi:heme/copper-type cytochrome/quinol oxidase subunit 1 [Microbacterium endophyticum]|uniref:Heme/copper-type cytochrome/quinol oxidase subunit 1 n=1 Tax=Microbacterium endophyticum TaxID=1526412 RepID=A0A7W4V5D4_9MICO|nr:hypothetical protein [Microbacterium endophyticum]MBB2977142.1 heme/copper-type cytochrome/quinol oxidase subunit 1 [Microbacterium endophyticum]NIK36070.1 heme/copper-type cytochrome/quinol oxidase subunit 1 [Microbacterium endophyticum]
METRNAAGIWEELRYVDCVTRERKLLISAAAVSAILVVTGALVFLQQQFLQAQNPASFGWFAYQPLANQFFFGDDTVFLSSSAVWGGVVCVIGVVGLAVLLGFLLGRRASRAASR